MHAVTFTITTDSSGDYDSSSDGGVSGQLRDARLPSLLYAVEWVDGTLADGVDAVLSMTGTPSGVDTTLLTLSNANNDAWYTPQGAVHDNTGTTTGYYTPQVMTGPLKLVVSNGGDTKSGKCIVYVLEA